MLTFLKINLFRIGDFTWIIVFYLCVIASMSAFVMYNIIIIVIHMWVHVWPVLNLSDIN